MPLVTYIILIVLVVVFISPLNIHGATGNEIVDYGLRAFYHANFAHLIANSISFLALSTLEEALGSTQYIFAIIFIWIVSTLILYTIHKIFPSRKVLTVGFSGVIFGLVVLYFMESNQNIGTTILVLAISILPQLFIPGISFEGHLSGIIAGFLYVLVFKYGGLDKIFGPRPKLNSNTKSALGNILKSFNGTGNLGNILATN